MKFEFTVEEANTILNAVAQLPYNVASPLIQKIQGQANNQEEVKEDEVEENE